MTIFFHVGSNKVAKKTLLRVLKIIVPRHNIIIIKDSAVLEHHLRRQLNDNLMAVLFPADKNQLAHIISLQKLFADIPIILVLPDRESDTIALGYKLRARFITYADSDFLDVAAVMMKIKDKMKPEESYL